MILNFQSEELRDICEKRSVATEVIGPTAALELAQKLADLAACETVSEFCSLNPDVVADISDTEKCIRLASGHQIKLRSGHPTYPDPPAEITNWSATTRVRIFCIEANHG